VPAAKPVRPATANRLLAALPARDRKHLLAGCEEVMLPFGRVLCEAGAPIRHVYFPTDSFVSHVAPIDGIARLEVGLVGDEGMVGISLTLGVDASPLQALVQGSGPAWRMSAEPFRRELARSLPLQRGLDRYLYVVMTQLAQTAACTRFHLVEARLARWLLMTQDRAHSDVFALTHEFLAYMLGVRRVGVTNAAGALQRRNLISYARGRIAVRDRMGLIAVACDCYRTDLATYSRILS
jgi:CRP-like cAMP-binding protein